MEDFKELQEGELEVLQSIFMDEFETVETRTAWKSVNANHEYRILIHPVEEALKGKVGVKIHFKVPVRYPKQPPSMTLEDAKGLSATHLASLSTALQRSAQNLLGSEMVYELCSQAAAAITDRNSVNGPQSSLGELRQKRGEEEERASALRSRQEQVARSQLEQREAARLSLLISEDVKKKEELRAEQEKAKEVTLDLPEGERSLVVTVCREKVPEAVQATVHFGLIAEPDGLGKMLPVEIMIGTEQAFAARAQVFDILASYFLTSQAKRKLTKIESELTHLRQLRHPHLISLYGARLTRYTPSFLPSPTRTAPRNAEGYTLVVLSESLPSQTLEDLLNACGELRQDRALALFIPIVGAVEYLHEKGMVHRAVRPRSVVLGRGKGREEVKLAESAWYQRLVDLNKSNPWSGVGSADRDFPDPWWDLGILLSQMLFGLEVYLKYRTPADLVRGIPRPSSIRKVLADLLTPDSKKRTTARALAAQLVETSTSGEATTTGLSTTPKNNNGFPMPRGPQTPLYSPKGEQLSKSVDAPVGFFWQPRQSGSRYRSEFEELEFLGRGGGGQVHLYAVKKVRLPNDKASEEKILREVTIWSRMNHPNIVRYHTSWVETDENPSSFDPDAESTQFTSSAATETESGDVNDTSSNSSDSEAPSDFDEDEHPMAPGDELDMDLGLDDLDDVDFRSIGHSKSVSYPSIHFGNEDDASRPSTAENSPVMSKRASRVASPTAASPVPKRMEYVEKLTLKEAIDEGESEVDAWRHMFQILSAMLHFTSLNIIHRDLKPSNIFLDAKGDVRIGDFGLAVNQGGLADPADVFLSVDSSQEEVDLTSGVGTSLYIAPETLSRGRNDRSVKYSNKIDMYSLGIVFFELFHPFKTGMERIQVLRELRKPDIVFPKTWDSTRLARHTKIIQSCLVHDPERRASPKDLLNSDLLPPRVGDDSIEETIRLLSHSGTQHAQTLITALFNQSDDDRVRKDFSYDFYDGGGAKVDNDVYGEIVRDKLSRIFRQKGAVCIDSPLLMPYSDVYASRKPVRLLDADGTVACLPYNLNIPFCRMVARDTALSRLKRWTIAPIYRPLAAGGQPEALLRAAFDIVSDAATAVSEAECLYIIEEIVAAFPFKGETVHFLNHSKILDAVVDKVPVSRRAAVLELLTQHPRSTSSHWNKTATELLKIHGVSRGMVEDMATLNSAGTVDEIRALLLPMVTTGVKHVVEEALDDLQDIISLCHQLGVKNVKVAPLLAKNWDFHRSGVLFETVQVAGKSRMSELAAGGRFDSVVAQLAAPDTRYSGRCPHVVGFSLNLAQLSTAAAEWNATAGKALTKLKPESLRSYGPWAVRRTDVYIVSFVAGLVEQRLDIVKDLWKAGIKADLSYDDAYLQTPISKLFEVWQREGINWLVIVKPGSQPDKMLKVRHLLKPIEEDVPRSRLASWLINENRSLDDDHHPAGASLEVALEAAHVVPESSKPTQDYVPILEDGKDKGKHKRRGIMIDRAQKSVDLTTAAATEAPVFAVDIDGPPFLKMVQSAAWITDDEAYRGVVQSAPPGKRDYLNSIRKTILNHHQNRGCSTFWLFSLRDDRSSKIKIKMPHVGATGLGPSQFQSLLSQAGYDPSILPRGSAPCGDGLCYLRWAGSDKPIASIVLAFNGIGFALQGALFLLIGPFADYGTWRPYITIFFTLLGVGGGFGYLGTQTADHWQTAGALYIIGNITYAAYLAFFTAAFPGLAADSPEMIQADKDLADGVLSPEEHGIKAMLKRSAIASNSFVLGSYGAVPIYLLCLPIVYGLHSDRSIAEQNHAYAALLAFVAAVQLAVSIPWFFCEQRRPGMKLPRGTNYLTIGVQQVRTAAKAMTRLPQTAIFLCSYFILADALTTSVTVAFTILYENISYSTPVVTLAGIVGVVGQGSGLLFIFTLQRIFKFSSKNMLVYNVACIIVFNIWGLCGIWTDKIGFRTTNEYWAFECVYGFFVCSWYQLGYILLGELVPSTQMFLFFSVFSIVGQTSSFIGPFITSKIIEDAGGNSSYAFAFLLPVTVVGAVILLFVDMKKAKLEAARFIEEDEAEARKALDGK
ncbi:hypothetical protein MNV49_006345 [Pseudohyphozyma bogoriensis]|nr:hypothetical protein MNV49_006345 [Pseudohyphozyma bogoriensis]